METILKCIKQIQLWREFKTENDLYCMVPLFNTTYCWDKSEDIPDMEESRTIYFDQMKEKQFFATIYNCRGKSYWKLYIVDGREIQKVYLETRMLNPISKK